MEMDGEMGGMAWNFRGRAASNALTRYCCLQRVFDKSRRGTTISRGDGEQPRYQLTLLTIKQLLIGANNLKGRERKV